MSYRTEIRNNQPQIFTRRQASVLLGLPVLLAAPFFSSKAGEGTIKLTVGTQPLPDTALMTQSGRPPLQLADLSEQALLVNFWASWCAPCIIELPALEAAAVQLKSESIQVILVNLDRGGAAVAQPFLDERGIITPLSAYDPKGNWPVQSSCGVYLLLAYKARQAEYASSYRPRRMGFSHRPPACKGLF